MGKVGWYCVGQGKTYLSATWKPRLSSLEVINSTVYCERQRSLSALSVYDIYLLKDLAFRPGTHSVIPRLTFSFLSSHTVFWPLSNCWQGLRVSPVYVSERREWASLSRREGLSAWTASNFGAEHERSEPECPIKSLSAWRQGHFSKATVQSHNSVIIASLPRRRHPSCSGRLQGKKMKAGRRKTARRRDREYGHSETETSGQP